MRSIVMSAFLALVLTVSAWATPRGYKTALVQFDEAGLITAVSYIVRIEMYAGDGPWIKVLVPADDHLVIGEAPSLDVLPVD